MTAAAAVLAAGVLLAGCGSVKNAMPTKTVTAQSQAATSGASYNSQTDETFLAQVRLIHAFDGESRKALIDLAHSVCNAFSNGTRARAVQILTDQYGIEAAAKFAHASVSVYCPENLSNS